MSRRLELENGLLRLWKCTLSLDVCGRAPETVLFSRLMPLASLCVLM